MRRGPSHVEVQLTAERQAGSLHGTLEEEYPGRRKNKGKGS